MIRTIEDLQARVISESLRLVLVYTVFSFLWILLSDSIVAMFFGEALVIVELAIIKGCFYVIVTSVLLYLMISRLMAKILTFEVQLYRMAFQDSLTLLPNRHLLMDRLTHALLASKRTRMHGAVMFIDLDNFKPINDIHGHDAGDLLLIEAANRLKKGIRSMDTVVRLGGDEFIVLLNTLGVSISNSTVQAKKVAEKILAAISAPYNLNMVSEGGETRIINHSCTASIGIALFMNGDEQQDVIIKYADMAMYQAKAKGRNQIVFSDQIPNSD